MSALTIELNESTQGAVSKKTNKSRRALSGRVSETQELTTPSPNPTPQDVETARAVERACTDLQWLVMREARRVARRVPYFTEIDDLIGAGSIGLVTAVQRHIDRPMPILQRFAQLRIRGAILDHLRMNDHLTRRQRAAVGQLR
jgi:DNA-directed RNA polymerase specialized sigma subunit